MMSDLDGEDPLRLRPRKDAGADQTPSRKRRRPAKSCEQCRRRKVRCDLEVPCAPCVRSRSGLECSYRDDSDVADTSAPVSYGPGVLDGAPGADPGSRPRPRAEAETEAEPNDTRGLEAKLQRLEQLIYGDHGQNTQVPNAHNAAVSPSRTLGSRVLRLEEAVVSQQQSLAGPIGRPSVTETDKPSRSAPVPHLRLSADRIKYYGASHWIHTMPHFGFMGKVDPKNLESTLFDHLPERGRELLAFIQQGRALRVAIKTQRQQMRCVYHDVTDLARSFPSRETCDHLVQSYLRTLEPVFRVVHIPSLWEEFERFWDWHLAQPSAIEPPTRLTIAKLALIFAIGHVFREDLVETSQLSRAAQDWICTAARWLTEKPFDKSASSMEALQVHCLIIIARQLCSLGSEAWNSAEALLRAALGQGLHLDPSHFPSLSVFQSEMRRRIWYTTLELVAQTSLDSSMPLLLSGGDFDVKPPANIDDTGLEPNMTLRDLDPLPSGRHTDCSLPILLSTSVRTRLQVVRQLNNLQAAQSYDAVIQLSTQLRTAGREMAAYFRASTQSEPRVATFHEKIIDIYLRRYLVFLHRPFVLQARTDPRYYLSRKLCLESCTAIASYAECLNLPVEPDNDLARLFIAGRGFYRGPLSLDLVTTLGIELATQLEEESAERGTESDSDPDPLSQAARASRTRLIGIIEHIGTQLREVMALGHPGTQRFYLTSAVLSHLRALESGRSVREAVFETMMRESRTAMGLLRAIHAADTPSEEVAAELALAAPVTANEFGLDLDGLMSLNWLGTESLDSWASFA